MKRIALHLRRISSVAIVFSLCGIQLNCGHVAANALLPLTTTSPTCYGDGIGCGTPALGAVDIHSFTTLPVGVATLMYNNAQLAGLKVDRLGTYWDWFMDQNGNYNPASPYLQQVNAQIAGDLANGVTPEFLLGTESANYMPGLQGPDNLPNWYYHPSQTAALSALANILANLVVRFSKVKYWELFNEMDSPGFTSLFVGAAQPSCPVQRGQLYGQMLNVVVPPARQVDPTIHILMGGIAGATDVLDCPTLSAKCGYSPDFDTDLLQTMTDFLRGMYRVGAGPNFDIVNAHAYADTAYWKGNTTNIIGPRLEAISAGLPPPKNCSFGCLAQGRPLKICCFFSCDAVYATAGAAGANAGGLAPLINSPNMNAISPKTAGCVYV
jgi:hypothetical protein